MKFQEAQKLAKELFKKQEPRMTDNDSNLAFLIGYERGMECIIRVLCDGGVIDNSVELEREKEGGY
jgi:hypothetical protein